MNYYHIKDDMITGTNIIIDKICERVKKLDTINEDIGLGKNILKKINTYAHKQTNEFFFNVKIEKIFGIVNLKIELENLPGDTQIFISKKLGNQRYFSSEWVTNNKTILYIPLPAMKYVMENKPFDLSIQLVATHCESQLWCILLNNSFHDSQRIQSTSKIISSSVIDRCHFLSTKLDSLRNLVRDENIDGHKLACMKKNMRNGLTD